MTSDALEIIHEAIRAVNPYSAIQSCVHREGNVLKILGSSSWDLSTYDEIVVVAFGKASSAMATAVVQQVYGTWNNDENDLGCHKEETKTDATTQQPGLRRLPCSGIVICKDGHATSAELGTLTRYRIDVLEASHPVPDIRSVQAADRLLDVVANRASSKTLVVCCISGGGSALFCRPTPPLTLEDLQHVNSHLLASGMGIQEMNVIRKRLEIGKGGRLAAKCYPSHVVTLVLSDVLGDPLDLIASGPTVCDTSTWEDAWRIVERYQLREQFPPGVMDVLQRGRDGLLEDSPSSDHPVFDTSRTVLVGNNQVAVNAAARTAESLGYVPVVLGTEIGGEAKEVAHMYSAMAKYLQQSCSLDQQQALPSFSLVKSLPAALIAGGETTVSLTPDSGKGGRNQELALAAAVQLCTMKVRNVVLASVGTDGGDGPTDAAGAVVDGTTVQATLSQAIDALAIHNAYPYLDALCREGVKTDRPLIRTGPTGTNVADICVTLIQQAPSPVEGQ
jgi:glycerate 2-kinase